MADQSTIDYIIGLLRTCPYIDQQHPLYLDFIGKDRGNFSIFPLAGASVVEEYLSGSRMEEYTFAIASRFSTADDRARRENSAFSERIEAWMRKVTAEGGFPDMGEHRYADKLEALGRGIMIEENSNLQRGQYQIQCRLVYFVKE